MEVSRIIRGSEEKCFSILMASLLEDIEAAEGKKVKLEDIGKGYNYTKQLQNKLGKAGTIRVTIVEIDSPSVYKASFESAQGVNTLSYILEKVDDTHFKLTYNEEFLSDKKSNNLNYGLMSKLYKRSNKKKANLVLNQIETLVQE
ncbi:hypothetical protein M2475_001139 [Breznakia sp. PF5-3]|uniref:DUF3284 domain-containing protein n=1 Tax=unclassified Breznakia TaxID=2623764 RepID=UPI002405D2B3|nr:MULTISPECIES: DUF3284 domain-containing protein [unclassified Breznakia]MDF9824637.1 hypothetical protein [Breznakia sp. PM6-1]MDF9835573.1 hypothetical protein [Breznakia sp. PF5-3]MDF9838691.1 hypothetical protein [Breznakia sp. PFB2-8]MDF9860722.1 hypothetical protein [Breznakia sp. PH5-24]